MEFADESWWEMVAATIAALHTEVGVPPTIHTTGTLAHMARERGQDVVALRAWLATQPKPAPPPQPPAPPQPPNPPQPPAPGPVVAGAPLVAAIKRDLEARGADLSGPCGAFAITQRVVWALRGQGAGLLDKPGGNNCRGFAVDIVVYRDGRIVDCLIGSGESNTPSWQTGNDPVDPARWRAPIDPADVA
jgi:hypothetical protein